MKSSTLNKRTRLSKERILALEELLSNRNIPYDSAPGVYVRTDKDRELDILWENFKPNVSERSPGVYLTIGFITGALCMFLMTAILNFGAPSKEGFVDLNLWKKGNQPSKEVSITPSSTQSNVRNILYMVKSGDTLDKIALKYYGSTSPEKVKKIQTLNNLSSPNQISIGQKLTIQVEN